MSRRVVVEEPCEHGVAGARHAIAESVFAAIEAAHGEPIPPDAVDMCSGGSRTVLEGIPDEWVTAGGDALKGEVLTWNSATWRRDAIARVVLAAVFGETP